MGLFSIFSDYEFIRTSRQKQLHAEVKIDQAFVKAESECGKEILEFLLIMRDLNRTNAKMYDGADIFDSIVLMKTHLIDHQAIQDPFIEAARNGTICKCVKDYIRVKKNIN